MWIRIIKRAWVHLPRVVNMKGQNLWSNKRRRIDFFFSSLPIFENFNLISHRPNQGERRLDHLAYKCVWWNEKQAVGAVLMIGSRNDLVSQVLFHNLSKLCLIQEANTLNLFHLRTIDSSISWEKWSTTNFI